MRNAIRSRAAVLALGMVAPLSAAVAGVLATPAHSAPAVAVSAHGAVFAQASPQTESSPEVTFTGGGLGLLLCGSRPEVPNVTVGAESKIRLTNGLGQPATLRIDGADSTGVASGETVEVQFHHGPVQVAMVPQCLLNLNPEFEQLMVEVEPAPRPSPSDPGSPATPSQPSRPTPNDPGSPRGENPELDEFPSFDEDALTDEDLANLADGDDGVVGTLFESPATVVNPDGSPANTLVSGAGPVDNGPIGLLAIIATICVVGVSAGAIRAIVTQRANQTGYVPSAA